MVVSTVSEVNRSVFEREELMEMRIVKENLEEVEHH